MRVEGEESLKIIVVISGEKVSANDDVPKDFVKKFETFVYHRQQYASEPIL